MAELARPLPLAPLLRDAWQLLNTQRTPVLHALTLPWVVHMLLNIWTASAPESAEAALPVTIVLRVALYALLAISIHRLILVGPDSVPRYGLGAFGLRELRYIGWTFAQGMIAVAVLFMASPIVMLSQPLGLMVAFMVACWLIGRVALVLPNIALDRALDLPQTWQAGRGAGFGLGFIVVGIPMFGAVLMLPFTASGVLPLQLLGMTGSLLFVAYATAGLTLAWQRLHGVHGDTETEPGPDIHLRPDAARGYLELDVQGAFQTRDFGHAASGDSLLAYHGRLRGLVIRLRGDAWAASEQSWDALDTLLSHLSFVRIHHEHLERVALVAPGDWEVVGERLGKHFGRARVRVFPVPQEEAAHAWAAGEG